MNYSMFNANFGSSILNSAYDLMILNEIDKEEKQKTALCFVA